ncbi:hypothetical protein SAMN05518849_1011177 [Sphingobium sp. AP50]|uniref:hypothetical protein n=1 Tax=Sphingobium sp. AP50 TaxID=1884369 RepID=UPI0008D47333|nr:hypothetical protein [Sphingobium sp. AP50]SEI87165.1 hypothetical protein SAMN05518849_1011177 [Sphingobium sp. AP50]
MTQLPEILAVVSRPIVMIAVGAAIYKIFKFFVSTRKAAGFSLSLTTAIFLAELGTIEMPDLWLASLFSTLAGFGILAFLFWKKCQVRI